MCPVPLVGGVSRLILVLAQGDFAGSGGALLPIAIAARGGDLLDVLDRVQRLRNARPHGVGCRRRRQTMYQLVCDRSGLQWSPFMF